MRFMEQLLDGTEVGWTSLGEITTITIGEFIHKNHQDPSSKYPVYNGGKSATGYYEKYNNTGFKIIVSARGANAGFVNYINSPYWAGNSCYSIGVKDDTKVYGKFIFYYLKENERSLIGSQQTGSIPAVSKSQMQNFIVPIPPISLQKEIVRILDTFTELKTELKTELDARKKQFSHYSDQLFSFAGQDVDWKPLGEVGTFQRGKRFVKTDMISEGVPCIHYGEMYTYFGPYAYKTKSFVSKDLVERKKLRVAQKNDVVLVGAGETIEDIGMGTAWLGDESAVTHDACFSFRSPLNPKYMAYFTRTLLFHNQIKKHIRTGKISAINEKGLSKAKIPVPSIEEQERIVAILDKFDTLTTSKTEGLPAEIEMRQKQYEYYRDMLLTFPKDKIEA